MLDIDRSDEILDGEFVNLDEPACTELVPVTQSVPWSPRPAPRPDPTFVAQLIATAEQAPQTREPEAGFAGGCADSLWRQPDPAWPHRLPDPANHLAFCFDAFS